MAAWKVDGAIQGTAEGMNAYMELLIQRANHRSPVAV
jgi:hypothetical protein